MNTLTKSFAKRVISMLLVTIMVFSLGIVGLTSASAANVELAETGNYQFLNNPLFYFDNSVAKFNTSYIMFMVGHNSYSKGYKMTNIAGTSLYYCNVGDTWGDALHFAIFGTNSEWGAENNSLANRKSYASKSTAIYNMNGNYDGTFLLTTNSSGVITPAHQPTGHSDLDHTQYAYAYSASYGSTSYTANGSAGTVKVSGKYLSAYNTTSSRSNTSTGGSDYTANADLTRTTDVTLTATPAEGYTFVGWATSESESKIVSTNTTYTYKSEIDNTKHYALFKESTPPVSFSNVTISAPESGTVGTPAVIQLGYDVEGSDSTPTYELLLNGQPCSAGWYTYDTTAKTVTVDPPVANLNYSFSVKITVDGVSVTTDAVTIAFRDELSAKLDSDNLTPYVDDEFTLTVTDNSSQYGDATYELYNAADDSLVESNDTGVFELSSSVTGKYTYYVTVRVDGFDPVNTNDLTIEVKAKIFNITLSAKDTSGNAITSILENRDFTITATPEFAQGAVTYRLTTEDGTLIEEKVVTSPDADCVFALTAKDVAEGAGSEAVTYVVIATDGAGAVYTDEIVITVNEDKGEFPVKIFFKCSDTYGYLPNAKINGAEVDLAVSDKIICYNSTESATYSWYSYTSATNTPYGTDFVFEVNANRNYFYNASYTVTAGEGKYDFDGTYYCYYLALENLNGGSNTLTNISAMTENDRNWTYSAVNMIYDDADASVPVGLNYSYAAIADANTDGSVNIKDATYIQKNLAKAVEASELSELVSDVNGDSKVTIKDATAIQKQLAGL